MRSAPQRDAGPTSIRVRQTHIHAFLTASAFTLYINTSGEALFKRGYRESAGEAPLRENLAAGILRLSSWQAGTPLLDPMCGSGTFLYAKQR